MSLLLPCLRVVMVVVVVLLTFRVPVAGASQHAATAALPDVTGVVTDGSGLPLAGATVYVATAGPRTGTSPSCPSCYADCGKHATTDAAGHFRIPSLSRFLVFRFLVVRDGYEPAYVPGVDPQRGQAVQAHLAREVTPDPAHVVAGTVVGPDGRPIAGAALEPQGIKSKALEEYGAVDGLDPLAVTDARGHFQFRCPQPDGLVYAQVTARSLAVQIASLHPGAEAVNRVALTVGAIVTGVVQDPRGKGMAGVNVEVVPADRSLPSFTGWQDIGTDENGRFTVPNVPPDKLYTVCVKMDRMASRGLAGAQRQVRVGADGSVCGGLRLTTGRAATLTGRVTLADGKAVPAETRVMLNRFGTWDSQQALVSAGGDYAFRGVPHGDRLVLSVWVRGYRYATDTPGFDPRWREIHVQVPVGLFQKRVPIQLMPDVAAAYTLRVSGTPGTRLGLQYDVMSPDSTAGNYVNGAVPAHYTVTASTVRANLQHLDGPGDVTLDILRGQTVVATGVARAGGQVVVQTR